jgi:hypothetical protein
MREAQHRVDVVTGHVSPSLDVLATDLRFERGILI